MAAGWRSIVLQVYSLRNCRFLLLLGGGYFFRLNPNWIAASTSVSNAMVSSMPMGLTSFHLKEDRPRLSCRFPLYHICQYEAVNIWKAPRRCAGSFFTPPAPWASPGRPARPGRCRKSPPGRRGQSFSVPLNHVHNSDKPADSSQFLWKHQFV